MTDLERAVKLRESAFYYGNLSEAEWLAVLVQQFGEMKRAAEIERDKEKTNV